MAVSGNGQSDPTFKQEERRWDLIGTSERAAGICLAKNSWKSSVELWKQAGNVSEGCGERWWEIPLGEGLWGEISAHRSHSSGKVGFSLLFSNRVATKVVTPRGASVSLKELFPCFAEHRFWSAGTSLLGEVLTHLTSGSFIHLPSPADVRTGCFRGIFIKSLSKITCFKKRLLVQAEIGFCSEAWGLWKSLFLFDFPVVNNYRFDILKLLSIMSQTSSYEMVHKILTNLKINTGLFLLSSWVCIL